MRPAYRFGIGFAVLLVGLGGGLLVWRASPGISRGRAEPAPLRPEGLEPAEVPLVGDLADEELAEQLDKLEDYERDRFGASEAMRRRRLRERLLRARLERRGGR